LISGFEIVECTGEDENFEILDSISFLLPLPEKETGSGMKIVNVCELGYVCVLEYVLEYVC
jgi:hypothetical protein